MANGPAIVLGATAVSFANNFVQTNSPDFKIVGAGLLFSLFDAGLGAIAGPQVATGLAVLMFIGVMVAPVSGLRSPMQTLAELPIAQGRKR